MILFTLGLLSGIAIGLFFRSQLSGYVKRALFWSKRTADDLEKKL